MMEAVAQQQDLKLDSKNGRQLSGFRLVTDYASIHALPVLDIWPWSSRK
jgi:hypothetical protein